MGSNEDCLNWFKVLTGLALGLEKREKVFAFAFRAWCLDEARNQVPGTNILPSFADSRVMEGELEAWSGRS